jgi:hypothetical protein
MRLYVCPITGTGTEDERPVAADHLTWWWVERMRDDASAVVCARNVTPEHHAALLAAGCTEATNDG